MSDIKLGCHVAVSYTHLDVYKRQYYSCLRRGLSRVPKAMYEKYEKLFNYCTLTCGDVYFE